MSFSDDILKFNRKVEFKTSNAFKATALQLFSNVILRTPVGNPDIWKGQAPKGYTGGRLRANWQADINLAPSGEINDTDESGRKAIASAKTATKSAKLGDRIYLINNLPYAQAIEDGHSSQAPSGMVKLTVAEFQRILSSNIKRN